MSNPLFLVPAGSLASVTVGETVPVEGDEAKHAIQVMRLSPGEGVDVADGAGRRVSGTVSAAETGPPARLEMHVRALGDERPATPALVLVQALAKGDRDLLAVQTATELGVDAVVPWQAERSIVRWKGPKAAKALTKWETALTSAAKQARRARVPRLREPVEGTGVAGVAGEGTLAVMLHEDAPTTLAEVLADVLAVDTADGPARGAVGEALPAEVVLVVGPEGGISPAEADALVSAGAVPARLGTHVLRSSTAGPAAVAVLQQLLGRW